MRIRTLLAIIVLIVPAMAVAPGLVLGAGPGQSSPNVEHVATIPLELGTWVTGRIHGDYLYVTGNKSFSIFDITDREAPELLSQTPLGAVNFVSEDPDTNGEILILSDERVDKKVQVWDVRDKRNPKFLASVPEMLEHTMACVLDCQWGIGPGGAILDLRQPSAPKLVNRWREPIQPGWGFDTHEVSPGRVIVSARTMHFFDMNANPAQPALLATASMPDNRVLHSAKWPRNGNDRFLLVQGETSPKPQCDLNSGAFMTWDTEGWESSKTFTPIDEFRVPAGIGIDGNPPVSALGCSATWFQEHPDFRNGGLVVGAYFDHGTRFLRVDRHGQIEQVGYFTPAGGSTLSTLWAGDDLVYSIDIGHGIDILRFTDPT